MELAVHLLALSVLSTADFCAAPIEGGVGEPQFCRTTSHLEIATPYFSIVVEPGFLVGVHDQGRKTQIQSSPRQSMDVMTLERFEGSQFPVFRACPDTTETVEDNVTWHDCRFSEGGIHHRTLVAEFKGAYVVVEFSYGRLSASSAPALERMTQSVRIHAI